MYKYACFALIFIDLRWCFALQVNFIFAVIRLVSYPKLGEGLSIGLNLRTAVISPLDRP